MFEGMRNFNPNLRHKFYLAGPFFNPAQLELQIAIEVVFCDHNVPFFSPRLSDDNVKGKITSEMAERIFRNNVEHILDCTAVLANLDWKLPTEFDSIRMIRSGDWPGRAKVAEHITNPDYPMSVQIRSDALNIPDSGTVFEMGFASALGKPIFGFTERPPEAGLNLMLTHCSVGIVRGLPGLGAFLNRGKFVMAAAAPWDGKNT